MRSVGPNAVRIVLLLALATLSITALAGCGTYPAAIFRPESPGATAIHDLAVILLIIAGVVLVGVEAVLIASVVLFGNRPEERAVQTYGNLRLETGWTVATAVVIFVILGFTVRTMADVTALPGTAPATGLPMASAFPGDTLLLRVVGHQWWWTFEYPDLTIVTANEAHVPAGRTVKLQLESDDVIHSFWAPQLGGKTDMIPGHINYSSFLATQPGVFLGECAEFCGAEHAHMRFRIIVDTSSEFSNWVRVQQAPAARPAEAERGGAEAFERLCGGCHAVAGTEARGRSGPDLTHFGSRQSIAANTLDNTPQNLARWLRNPQEVKPDNKMPDLHLDQTTVDRLVAYLESLK